MLRESRNNKNVLNDDTVDDATDHENSDDHIEQLTQEEVEGVLVELVVDVFNKQIQKLHKFLLVTFYNSLYK